MPPTLADLDEAPLPAWAAACDAAAMLALFVAAAVTLGGGFRVWIGDVRLSVTSPGAIIGIALLLLIWRHARVRRPDVVTRLRAATIRLFRSDGFGAARGPFLATRLGVAAVGLMAVYTVGYPPGAPPIRASTSEIVNLPLRWDAGWYCHIARLGYRWDRQYANRQHNIAFFPAYPTMIWLGGRLFGGSPAAYVFTGVAISHVAFLWGLVLLYQLAKLELGNDAMARASVLLLAYYPFSVFHGAVYTESLFLLGAVGACLSFKREQWNRCALWGLLVGLSRPNGFLLALTLGTLAYTQRVWRARSPDRSRTFVPMVAAIAPLAGAAIFSLYIASLTGNPLQWAAQHAAWGRTFKGALPLAEAAAFATKHGVEGYLAALPYDVLNAVPAVCALVLIVPVWLRLGPAYGVFLLTNLVPPLVVGGVMSMGRLTATMFPLFLWLGARTGGPTPNVTVAFVMLQALAAVLFYTWRPLY
jgi:hypothetical protein